MARSTKEEALETRARILDAAERVFHERGVSHTSLADVAKAADVTRGAIYWHFKNKGDLFDAMCERVRLPMEAVLEESAGAHVTDPMGQFLRSGVYVLTMAATDERCRKVFDIIFNKCEFADHDDPILVRQRECHVDGMLRIEQIIGNAISRGQLPATLDVRQACLMMHATFSGLLTDWFFSPDSFDLVKDGERILSAAHYALSAPSMQLSAAAPSIELTAAAPSAAG